MDLQKSIFQDILDYTQELSAQRKIIDTHCHHLTPPNFEDITLHKLLQMTYISWQCPAYPDTPEGRRAYLERVGCNSYFYWMSKGIGKVYGTDGLNEANWDETDRRIREAYREPDYDIRLLRETCGYGAIILDKYDDCGSDNGLSGLMTPTLRCDMFLFGYADGKTDENKNNPRTYTGCAFEDGLDEYIDHMAAFIAEKKKQGCVALKLAIAYERDISFECFDKEKAKKAYGNSSATPEQIRDFQDYIVFCICETAAKLNIPVQIHTGLGGLHGSRAMGLHKLIKSCKETKFVLFHGSYPWIDDVFALLHNYPNVYPDLCWLPLISTERAKHTLHELLEVGHAHQVCWGCDTWTSEESVGALSAISEVLADVLSKRVSKGLFSKEYALMLTNNILSENASQLYNIR